MSFSPYDVLGLDPEADLRAIKKAYRRAAKRCHPDRVGNDPEKLARFHAVSRAYELLKNEDKRRFFDRYGKDPSELGLDDEAIRAATRTVVGRRENSHQVPRAECTVCDGSGLRRSGRICTNCYPEGAPRPTEAGQDNTPPPGFAGFRAAATKPQDRPARGGRTRFNESRPPAGESVGFDPTQKVSGGRVRLRPKKKKR